MAIVGRMRPKVLDGVYFRDIPKSDNPVQDAVLALSYKNPHGRTLEDILPEQNLISYVLLDCLDKEKIEIEEDEIRIKWQLLSEGEKETFEKISLIDAGKAILNDDWEDDCPLEKISDDDYVIHLDKINKYSRKLDEGMKIKSESAFRKQINSEDWFLVLKFLDDKIKKRFKILGRPDGVSSEVQALRVNVMGFVSVSVIFAAFLSPIAILAAINKPVMLQSNPFLIAYCLLLAPPTIAKFVAFIVERFEKYTPEELELTKQIRGLKNWIEDFTNIKDQPPSASIVWGDFIKWGYLLGVSQKAIRIAQKYSTVEIVKLPKNLEQTFAIRLATKIIIRDILIRSSPFPLNWIIFFWIRMSERYQ